MCLSGRRKTGRFWNAYCKGIHRNSPVRRVFLSRHSVQHLQGCRLMCAECRLLFHQFSERVSYSQIQIRQAGSVLLWQDWLKCLLFLQSGALQDDEEIVKVALTQDGEALEFASDRLKGKKDIVLLAIKTAPWTAFYASEKLKADKELIMASVKDCGQTLYYASEKLRDDEEVVRAAVANKGIIIKYASYRLRNNKEIAKIAMEQDKRAYQFLTKELKQDEEIKALKG